MRIPPCRSRRFMAAGALAVLLLVLSYGSTAFCSEIHEAAEHGDLEKVRALLAGDPSLAKEKNLLEQTALELATFNNHPDVVAALLQFDADINHRTTGGLSALYIAADKGYADIVKLLLAHDAKVNISNGG